MEKVDLNVFRNEKMCEAGINIRIDDSNQQFFDALWVDDRKIVISINCGDKLMDKKDEKYLTVPLTGYDMDGNVLVEVPWKWVTGICTDKEMHSIMACQDADERLLSYAR